MSGDGSHPRSDPRLVQPCFQRRAFGVIAAETKKRRSCSESGDIHRDIRSAAWLFSAMLCPNHWHRRLRGDSVNLTPNVAVKHHVTYDDDVCIFPIVLDELNNSVQIFDHLLVNSSSAICARHRLSSTQSQSMWPQRM